MSELEKAWERFIEELNRRQPLEKGQSKHTNFLGSIGAYKKIFMKANEQHDVHPDAGGVRLVDEGAQKSD